MNRSIIGWPRTHKDTKIWKCTPFEPSCLRAFVAGLVFLQSLAGPHLTRCSSRVRHALSVRRDRAPPLQQLSRNSQIGQRLRMERADSQGFAEMVHRLVECALFEERGPPVDVCVDAIRTDSPRR